MTLFVEELGTGTAVVVLHGAPTTIGHMRPLAKHLAGRRRTLLVHLPGYGKSPRLDPYDLERSHGLVEETLAARGIESAHFVGLSGGSYRSFAIACRKRIRVLSVCAIGGLANVPEDEGAGLIEYAKMLRRGDPPGPILEQVMLSPASREDPAIVADVRSWTSETFIDHLADELIAFATAPDLRHALATLDIPILLRVGSADAATPPLRSERIAELVKHSRLQVVEGKGHAILAEDPDATFAEIERHLDMAESR